MVDDFGRRIDPIGIVTSGTGILDVVPRLELLETLGAGVVDVLGIGDELGRRRRSVGSRLLGFCLYPIILGRFSSQYRTDADRCTPTLPR